MLSHSKFIALMSEKDVSLLRVCSPLRLKTRGEKGLAHVSPLSLGYGQCQLVLMGQMNGSICIYDGSVNVYSHGLLYGHICKLILTLTGIESCTHSEGFKSEK